MKKDTLTGFLLSLLIFIHKWIAKNLLNKVREIFLDPNGESGDSLNSIFSYSLTGFKTSAR